MAIIIATDRKLTQTEIANVLRAQFAELWKLPPAERKARIDEILKPERNHVTSR